MKIYIYIIAAFLCLCTVIMSCEKGLKIYEGEDSIYFSGAYRFENGVQVGVDTTLISFAYAKPTVKDSTMLLPVKIEGNSVNIDREFKVSILPTSTAIQGTHYQMLGSTFVIPANKVTGNIGVSFKRTTDMLDKSFSLALKLEENNNFKTLMQDVITNVATGKKKSFIQHTVWVNDILKKPRGWYDTYLGVFSRKKLLLLVEIFDISNMGDLDDTIISPPSKSAYYGTVMQRYLNEKKAMGETVYEEDGVTEMIMGPTVQ